MVDVSGKNVTTRLAIAKSIVELPAEVEREFKNNDIHTKKGSVFNTATIAGVMAAKKTAELIPFCHPIPIDDCQIIIEKKEKQLMITCEVKTSGRTGVEMEALTGASVAALTVYDMCKALSHHIEIKQTCLLKKTGGKKDFER